MSNFNAADVISRHIREHACEYFPSLDKTAVSIRMLEERQRTVSALYRFEVSSHAERYCVFAKGTPLSGNKQDHEIAATQRARLVPPLKEYGKRLWLEYTALKTIHDHFARLENPSFGTIRALDFMEDTQTLLMEENRDPNLLSLFSKTTRLRHPFRATPDLRRAFFNAGSWLKAYSMLPKTATTTPRHSSRDEYIDSIESFSGFLGNITGNRPFFDKVADTANNIANQVLPSELPLAMGHGDYAMRNILVGANARVTVIDTNAKWLVPMYEDIAYFLIRLDTNKLQVFTQGRAIPAELLESYQREFLSGYFDRSPVPETVIRLFQIQSLLDNWSSRAADFTQPAAPGKAMYRKTHLALLNRHYRNIMLRLLQDFR